MATREFHRASDNHAGVKVGDKFKTVKDHHEVKGDLTVGVELVLDGIVHYPTRYLLKDDEGNLWTVPIHSVEKLNE